MDSMTPPRNEAAERLRASFGPPPSDGPVEEPRPEWPKAIRVHPGVLDALGDVEWGEPDQWGFYSPTIRTRAEAAHPATEGLDEDALATALHATEHPAIEDCRLGLNTTVNGEPPEWAGVRKCEWDAERLAEMYSEVIAHRRLSSPEGQEK